MYDLLGDDGGEGVLIQGFFHFGGMAVAHAHFPGDLAQAPQFDQGRDFRGTGFVYAPVDDQRVEFVGEDAGDAVPGVVRDLPGRVGCSLRILFDDFDAGHLVLVRVLDLLQPVNGIMGQDGFRADDSGSVQVGALRLVLRIGEGFAHRVWLSRRQKQQQETNLSVVVL